MRLRLVREGVPAAAGDQDTVHGKGGDERSAEPQSERPPEEGWRRAAGVSPPVETRQLVMRVATLYLVTDVRRPGVSPAGIAFRTSSARV